MRHVTAKKQLSAYYDGELREDERHALEEHLAECPECRAELEQMKRLSGLVKAHGLEPVPPSLRRDVLEPRASRRWLKPVLALSAAAAGLLVVFNLTKPDGTTYMVSSFASRDSGELYSPALQSSDSAPEGPAEPAESGAASSLELANAGGGQAPAAPAPARQAEKRVYAPAEAEAKAEADEFPAEERKAAPLSAAAAVRGSVATAKFARSKNVKENALFSGAKAAAEAPCFCISPSAGDDSPYAILRLPEPRCEGAVFKPRPESSASAYLSPCPPGLGAENAADLQESCFCIAHNPDSPTPYTIGRVPSPDCATVRFKARPGIPAGKYLPACPKP